MDWSLGLGWRKEERKDALCSVMSLMGREKGAVKNERRYPHYQPARSWEEGHWLKNKRANGNSWGVSALQAFHSTFPHPY